MNEAHDRKHPFRLSPEAYTDCRTPIFLTMCFKPRSPIDETLAGLMQQVVETQSRRWGLALHAYCLMPNHVHIVLSVSRDGSDFEMFVRRTKAEFSRRAHRSGSTGFTWERSFWDRHAREEEQVRVRIEYTLDNPVRKGLCRRREEWPWAKYYGWTLGEDEIVPERD